MSTSALPPSLALDRLSVSPAFNLLLALPQDCIGAVLSGLHVAEVCASLAPVARAVRVSAQRALSLPRRVVHRGDAVDGAPYEWLAHVFAAGVNVRALVLVTNTQADRLLHHACHMGLAEMVDIALRRCCPRANVNVRSSVLGRVYGEVRPLHVAARGGHVGVVEHLMRDERVDVNARCDYGWTPLHTAARHGYPDVIDCLLRDERVDVNVRAVDNGEMTPLHAAARHGYVEVVDCLLRDERVDVNARTKVDYWRGIGQAGMTPLHSGAFYGCVDVVDRLLRDERVDVNARSANGSTPLDAAFRAGYVAVAARLKRDHRCNATT